MHERRGPADRLRPATSSSGSSNGGRGPTSTDPDPIDRHFQFAELEARLYCCRDLYDTALDEFDEACQRHDAEMETICAAFMTKWGKVPLLETYRQMAIRQQKRKDWEACRWWAERGLELYGSNAARAGAVEDLLKRRNRALAKLEAQHKEPRRKAPAGTIDATIAERSDAQPATPAAAVATNSQIEILLCTRCGGSFERVRVRGRKPLLCPACRTSASDERSGG